MILLPKYVICARMKTIFVIFLWCFLGDFPLIRGQECTLGTIQTIYINDTSIAVPIATTTAPSTATVSQLTVFFIQKATLSEETALTYFSAAINDSVFTLSTTEEFQNVGQDADSSGEALFLISLSVVISCENSETYSSNIAIGVSDTYRNDPIFSASSYTYKIPMPIMPRADIALYGEDELGISDINFSNNGMTLTISPEDFNVTATKTNNKQFNAVFRAKRILNFSKSQTYTLTATNSGGKTKQVQVLIEVDPVAGLDAPSFKKSHYSFNYSTENTGLIISNDGDVVIDTGKPNEAKTSLEGDSSEYFLVTYKNTTQTFEPTMMPDTTLPSDVASQVILTLSFITDATANTVLLINIIKSEIVPQFDSMYYTGTYDIDTNVITWKKEVGINDAVEVTLTDVLGNSSLFTIDQSSYKIKPNEVLTKSDFDENLNIIFTVSATSSTNNKAQALVIISLKTETSDELKFKSVYYSATYSVENGKGIVTFDSGKEIGFSGITDFDGITINVDDSYEANFKVELNLSKWIILVISPLNDTTLNDNSKLAIPLTATKTGVIDSAKTVIILTLPDKVEIQFGSLYYSGSYLKGTDKDYVQLDEKITVTGAALDDITVVVDGYENNFKATCNSETFECTISVENQFNSSILSSHEELPVTLTASNKDQTSSGKTILLLKLPKRNSTFSFSKQHYSALYSIQKSDSEFATIALDGLISLEGVNSTEFTIVPDAFSDYLKFSFESSTWQLNIQKNLEANILSFNTELVISLTAAKKDDTNQEYAKATLIVKLPNKTTVKFDGLQYYGKYIIDNSANPKVVLDDDSEIKISESDNTEIVLNSYSDIFKIVLDSDSKWAITTTTSLNSSILSQYSELKLIMTIKKVGVLYGNAGLTIALPSFGFSKDIHHATYSVNEDGLPSILGDSMTIANSDASYLQVNLTDYNEYFFTELSDDKWILQLGKSLPASITSNTLVTNIQAIRKSDSKILATSTLVITLPVNNSTDAPSFSAFTFSGTYENSDTPSVHLNELIAFAIDNTVAVSSVYIDSADNYSSNFNLVPKDDKYDVEVTNRFSQDVLDEVTSVALTLVANSSEGHLGKASLVIALPKAVRNVSVQFENQEILYSGTYKDGVFNGPSITLNTNRTHDNEISVDISNELGIDDSYFTKKYSNKVLAIQVGKLPDDVLKSTAVIPLKLAITDTTTQDTVYAVLNVEVSGNGNNGDDGGSSTDPSRTGLIVAVAILAFLLVILLLGALIFWYCKIRKNNKKKEIMVDEVVPAKTNVFTKNEKKPVPISSNPLRRPTGLGVGIIDPLPEESSSDISDPSDTSRSLEFEKKVAFDEDVQKIDENGEYNDNDDDDDVETGQFQSLADRRPTKFVFRHPDEEVLDIPNERRESSDYNINTGPGAELPDNNEDKRKSVAFDEIIERMDIDPVEDDEDESENLEEVDSNNDSILKADLEIDVVDNT